jgi:cullin-associated NEDD8-dissociated protein 1
MLQQTRPLIVKGKHQSLAAPSSVSAFENPINVMYTSKSLSSEIEERSVTLLKTQISSIVKAVQRLLKNKSAKTRQGCFSLLTQLVTVLPGALNQHLAQILPGVNYSLNDKNSTSNMKIDTLNFLNHLLITHDDSLFHPYLDSIAIPIIKCNQDNFYKIASDALLVSQQLAKILRSALTAGIDCGKYVESLYNSVFIRLKQTDIDQEVKERAIFCIAQIICYLGDLLNDDLLNNCWPILIERLKNEITRLTTVKSIHTIFESKTKVNLCILFPEALPLIASFLRKNYRTLKLASINCLLSMYKNYSQFVSIEQLKSIIIIELPALLTENDLHISYVINILIEISNFFVNILISFHFISFKVALKLATLICKSQGPSIIAPVILKKVLLLVQSPLLQGQALESSIEFLIQVVEHKQVGLQYNDIIEMLVRPIYETAVVVQSSSTNESTIVNNNQQQLNNNISVHKHAFYSIAKCIAALTVKNQNEGEMVIKKFINDIKDSKSPDSVRLLALLSLGETGKYIELSNHNELEFVILNSFSSSIEEIKSAASYALGYLSLGNLQKYIPFILNEIESNSKRQYLLFNSLKEIITYESTINEDGAGYRALQPFISPIWETLIKHCECAEEGTRNVVAECIGKLTLLDPQTLIPNLKVYLDSPSALARSTVVTAIKFTIIDQPQPIDILLKECLGKFLNALQDSDINVRRVALVTFNSAAHNKPSLIRDLLLPNDHKHNGINESEPMITSSSSNSSSSSILINNLYKETKIRKELIRDVEMGPFKHTVDDGLDLRKAAFECMYTLLDSCLDRIDIFEFLNHVEDGLKDHYDIKMLTYLMLVRLSTLCPNALLQSKDSFLFSFRFFFFISIQI